MQWILGKSLIKNSLGNRLVEDKIIFNKLQEIKSKTFTEAINLFALIVITPTLTFSSFYFEQNAEKLIENEKGNQFNVQDKEFFLFLDDYYILQVMQ